MLETHMNFEQIQLLTPQIMQIARKHSIVRVYVFGSVARGEASPQSDVDFLVEMRAGASLFGVAGFGYEVEKLLGIPVDVVPMSALACITDQEFLRHIQNEAVAI